jgi:hypothetical protein
MGVRRFTTQEAWQGGALSRALESLEKDHDALNAEVERITNDLLRERQLREIETERADRAEARIAGFETLVAFFREQNVMIMSKCGALIATINGLLPEAGLSVLAIFKNLKAAIDKQTKDIESSIRDHLAGNKEQAEQKRREQETADAAKATEELAAGNLGIKPRPRTLEEIGEELTEITAGKPPRQPLGAAHESIRNDMADVTGRAAASAEGKPVERDDLAQRVIDKISGKA